MLKAQTGKSLNTTSTAQDAELNQVLANTQAQLLACYDWPFLKCRWAATMNAGARYQTFPTVNDVGLTCAPDFTRPMRVETKWNQIWQEVVYGIDEIPEFNYLDSDRNAVLDPAQRWEMSDETKFEIWPLPASAATLRFIGMRTATTLAAFTTGVMVWNDAALCDIDDLLLVYTAAAEYLSREEKPGAQNLAAMAARRLNAILGAQPQRSQVITIGRGQPLDRKAIRQIPMVVVAAH